MTEHNYGQDLISLRDLNLNGRRYQQLSFIPHAINVVSGPRGSGKSQLIHDVFLFEAERRLSRVQNLSRLSSAKLFAKPVRWQSIQGLLPAALLSTEEFSSPQTLADALGFKHALSQYCSKVAQLRCARADCALRPASPGAVAQKLSAETGSSPDAEQAMLAVLLPGFEFTRPVTAAELTLLLHSYLDEGVRRFAFDSDVIKAEEALAWYTEKAFRENESSPKVLRIVHETLAPTSSHREIEAALERGHQISGEEVYLARLEKKPDSSQLKLRSLTRSATGLYCDSCGYSRPAASLRMGAESSLSFRAITPQGHAVDLYLENESERELLKKNAKELLAILKSTPLEKQLECIADYGLDSLSLSVSLSELSPGQRLLFNALRFELSSITETLFLLEQPSEVLAPKDLAALFSGLERMTKRGNTCVITELPDSILPAYGLELKANHVINLENTETLKPTAPRERPRFKRSKRAAIDPELLRSINSQASFALGKTEITLPPSGLLAVVGPAGSGKSRLLKTIADLRKNQRKNSSAASSKFSESKLLQVAKLDKEIAKVFAALPLSARLKLSEERFLLGHKAGRCPRCQGRGLEKVGLEFSSSGYETCVICFGTQFQDLVLEPRFKEKNIAEVLSLSVREAVDFFRGYPAIERGLSALLEFFFESCALKTSIDALSVSERNRLRFLRALKVSPDILAQENPFWGLSPEEIELFTSRLRPRVKLLVFTAYSPAQVQAADYVLELTLEGQINYFGTISDFPLDVFAAF